MESLFWGGRSPSGLNIVSSNRDGQNGGIFPRRVHVVVCELRNGRDNITVMHGVRGPGLMHGADKLLVNKLLAASAFFRLVSFVWRVWHTRLILALLPPSPESSNSLDISVSRQAAC